MTFAPSTRRIYVRSVRVAFGLQVLWPPRPPRGCLLCGSCSSGQSFVFGFLPASPREATVTVQLGVPSHRGPQGTLTPKSLPARLSPHGYCPPIGGPRHAWRTMRRERSTLRCPLSARWRNPTLHDPCPQIATDHTKDPFVPHTPGHSTHQDVVLHRVEELFQVQVHHPSPTLPPYTRGHAVPLDACSVPVGSRSYPR